MFISAFFFFMTAPLYLHKIVNFTILSLADSNTDWPDSDVTQKYFEAQPTLAS